MVGDGGASLFYHFFLPSSLFRWGFHVKNTSIRAHNANVENSTKSSEFFFCKNRFRQNTHISTNVCECVFMPLLLFSSFSKKAFFFVFRMFIVHMYVKVNVFHHTIFALAFKISIIFLLLLLVFEQKKFFFVVLHFFFCSVCSVFTL